MGQMASAMGNKTTFEPDPHGFSGSEWGARLLGKGMQGLGQGMQQMPPQRQGGGGGGGGAMNTAADQGPATPQFSTGNLPGGVPATGAPNGMPQKPRNPLFYGYGANG